MAKLAKRPVPETLAVTIIAILAGYWHHFESGTDLVGLKLGPP